MNIKKRILYSHNTAHSQYLHADSSPPVCVAKRQRGSVLIEAAGCVALMALGGATAMATFDKAAEAKDKVASVQQLYLTAAAQLNHATAPQPAPDDPIEAAWKSAVLSAGRGGQTLPTDFSPSVMYASGSR